MTSVISLSGYRMDRRKSGPLAFLLDFHIVLLAFALWPLGCCFIDLFEVVFMVFAPIAFFLKERILDSGVSPLIFALTRAIYEPAEPR